MPTESMRSFPSTSVFKEESEDTLFKLAQRWIWTSACLSTCASESDRLAFVGKTACCLSRRISFPILFTPRQLWVSCSHRVRALAADRGWYNVCRKCMIRPWCIYVWKLSGSACNRRSTPVGRLRTERKRMAPRRSFECPICLQKRRVALKHYFCDHLVCNLCCGKWRIEGGQTCPVCRAPDRRPRRKIVVARVNVDTTHEAIEEFVSRFPAGTRVLILRG